MNDFYKPRWEQFFVLLEESLQDHQEADLSAFEKISGAGNGNGSMQERIFLYKL